MPVVYEQRFMCIEALGHTLNVALLHVERIQSQALRAERDELRKPQKELAARFRLVGP